MKKSKGPRVLLVDIETAPMLGYVWSLWDQNVGLNQVKTDWFILSYAAKWLDDKKIIYKDQRNEKNIEDDSTLLESLWKLLDEADIVIGQNSKQFDHKKINARFILNGFQPPSTYKHIDTKILAKRHFAFTSNRLEYMSEKLCKKYKKLKKRGNFSGFEMWSECLKGNMNAWKHMEKYNKYDVLALEELYKKLIPWDNSIDFNIYSDSLEIVCKCGSKEFKQNGYAYTASGRYHRYKCKSCGSETRGRQNLLSKDKRVSLRANTARS